MKKVILCFCLCSFSSTDLFSQDWGRFWCFGDSAGINFSNLSAPVADSSWMDCAESCAAMGDTIHGLLAYAHTDYWPLWIAGSYRTTVIHNKNHQIMIYGDSLIGNAFHGGLTFINKPNYDSLFYLFQWGFRPDSGLFYSILNPFYSNNSGIVFKKNQQLPLGSNNLQMGELAIKHANGRDWWIIVRNWWQSNRFNLFLVEPDTIAGPFEQDIGSITTTDIAGMAVSKDGSRLALVNYDGLIETYLFDRCSGQISNPNRIFPVPSIKYFGCEFSPNGNLLYVSNTDNIFGNDSLRIFQFDLTSPNPAINYQIIYSKNVPVSGGFLKRGPDDKIYTTGLYEIGWRYPDSARNQYNENLGVIQYPDSFGVACAYNPFSFYLGGRRTYWNLPNNPNYLLGPLTGTICDSLTLGIKEEKSHRNLQAFPNPASNKVFVLSEENENEVMNFYSMDSKIIYSGILRKGINSFDVSSFPAGIYVLRVNRYQAIKIIISR